MVLQKLIGQNWVIERPGEVGDYRKALEIGLPPSSIPLGHGEGGGDSPWRFH